MRTGLLRRVKRWRRRRLAAELGRLGERELLVLLELARVWESRPRRWWFVEECEVAWVIGG